MFSEQSMFTVRAKVNPTMLISDYSIQLLRQMTNVSSLSVSSDVLVACAASSPVSPVSAVNDLALGLGHHRRRGPGCRALRNPSTAWPGHVTWILACDWSIPGHVTRGSLSSQHTRLVCSVPWPGLGLCCRV